MSSTRRGALMGAVGASLVLAMPQARAAQASDAASVAGFESAGELLGKCRQNSSYAKSYCFAYLAAVADASRSYRVWIGSGDPCLPPVLTLGKLADIFEAYLIANPSLTRAQAASVIVASLQESFPCAPPAPPAPAPAPAPLTPSQQSAENQVDPRPQQDRQAE